MPPKRCAETFWIRTTGPLACFTRPEFKVERVSYEAMTPSAARGILEAVHWKPAIRWVVTAIHVLAPVNFISFKRNEVASRATPGRGQRVLAGEPYFVEEDRQQRNTVALRDVDYVVEAHFAATPRWGEADTFGKHVEIVRRRLEKGQTFHQPYFGCREFAASVEPVDSIPESRLPKEWRPRDLGLMLHDLEFGPRIVPRFFAAKIDETGKIDVPPFEEGVPGEDLATREGT
jgi:CRISPR-associated protein Cas5d